MKWSRQQPPIPETGAVTVQGKSEFHLILDDITLARRAFESAQHRLSQLILTVGKGVKFAEQIEGDLTKAIADNGGTPMIEAEINNTVLQQYAPKRIESDEG
jgi:hypothetical protein